MFRIRKKEKANAAHHDNITLLHEFQEQFLHCSRGNIYTREQLWDVIEKKIFGEFSEHEFEEAFWNMLEEYSTDLSHIKRLLCVKSEDLLQSLRRFSQGESVHFTDSQLILLIWKYETSCDFKESCDTETTLRHAFQYWQDEYYHRMRHDAQFAAEVVLRKCNYPYNDVETRDVLTSLNTQEYKIVLLHVKDCKMQETFESIWDSRLREILLSWLKEQHS